MTVIHFEDFWIGWDAVCGTELSDLEPGTTDVYAVTCLKCQETDEYRVAFEWEEGTLALASERG